MLTNNRMENSKKIISLVREYFGENVTSFYQSNYDNGEDFKIECLIYRSFLVSFSLADIPKGGIFDVSIGISGKMFGLYTLTSYKNDIPLSFTEESINKNIDILNEYLIWSMSEAQKETFNINY